MPQSTNSRCVAIASPVEREVCVRVAGHGDDLYIDLGDRNWHVLSGSQQADGPLSQSPPVRFKRTRGMLALPFPDPCRGTSIDALRPSLNVNAKRISCWSSPICLPPYTRADRTRFRILYGEQGSAKTSLLRRLLSPHPIQFDCNQLIAVQPSRPVRRRWQRPPASLRERLQTDP